MNLETFKQSVLDSMKSREDVVIEFTTTQKCNCHCDYCFECGEHHEMSHDEAILQLKLIVDYCNQFDVSKYRRLVITFWGGEPFLNVDFMLDVINSTYTYDFVIYRAYTNGTQHENYLRLIELLMQLNIEYRFHVQLSYDGDPHHEKKRHYSKSTIFESARLFQKHHVQISFKSTLSFDMISKLDEIWDSYEQLYEEFGNEVSYSPTLDLTTSTDQYLDIWHEKLLSIAQRELRFYSKHGHHLMTYFAGDAKRICNVNNSISINVDGNIYCCHGCSYETNSKDFVLQNTQNVSSLNDVIRNDIVDITKIPSICNACPAMYCAVCHVKYIKSKDDLMRWTSCMPTDRIRCKYFQIFGEVYRAFRLARLRVNK